MARVQVTAVPPLIGRLVNEEQASLSGLWKITSARVSKGHRDDLSMVLK